MLTRGDALETLLRCRGEADFVVAGLGHLCRDLYARSGADRDRGLYCMGSMGSVTPVALGLSLARPDIRFLAVEGDGSLLMNLGALVTLRRYGSSRVRLMVFDNGTYETTGGQASQPDGFALEAVCASVGLATSVARTDTDIADFLASEDAVLVVKTSRSQRTPPRIDQSPTEIAAAFRTRIADRPRT